METIEVKTGYGALRGSLEHGLAVFRGVPFARSTEGPGRFSPPTRIDPWEGVREATNFGPACPQRRLPGRSVFGSFFAAAEIGMSEDCLSLNIWTPAADDGRRPVMVWIHGGAFRMGTGASPTYDASKLARRGDVVVVTINYRVGPLGFLYFPQIGPANIGLLDQAAALEWVQDQIENFGGDPDNVTIFGESAGGKSVECLVASPARRMFKRAIAQSTYAPPMDVDSCGARTRALLNELSIGEEEIERLREIPATDILEANLRVQQAANDAGENRGGFLTGMGPVVDGEFLTEHPLKAVSDGSAKDIPMIIGTTVDESRLWGAAAASLAELTQERLEARLATVVPGAARDPGITSRALEIYRRSIQGRARYYRSHFPELEDPSPADIYLAATTDNTFRQHSIRLAEAQAGNQPGTYMYLFTWPAAGFDGRLRACHAAELPFVFGSFDSPLGRIVGESPDALELSETIQDSWIAFTRSGSPNHSKLPEWPGYEAGERQTMILGRHCELENAPLEEERRLWNP